MTKSKKNKVTLEDFTEACFSLVVETLFLEQWENSESDKEFMDYICQDLKELDIPFYLEQSLIDDMAEHLLEDQDSFFLDTMYAIIGSEEPDYIKVRIAELSFFLHSNFKQIIKLTKSKKGTTITRDYTFDSYKNSFFESQGLFNKEDYKNEEETKTENSQLN